MIALHRTLAAHLNNFQVQICLDTTFGCFTVLALYSQITLLLQECGFIQFITLLLAGYTY